MVPSMTSSPTGPESRYARDPRRGSDARRGRTMCASAAARRCFCCSLSGTAVRTTATRRSAALGGDSWPNSAAPLLQATSSRMRHKARDQAQGGRVDLAAEQTVSSSVLRSARHASVGQRAGAAPAAPRRCGRTGTARPRPRRGLPCASALATAAITASRSSASARSRDRDQRSRTMPDEPSTAAASTCPPARPRRARRLWPPAGPGRSGPAAARLAVEQRSDRGQLVGERRRVARGQHRVEPLARLTE